MTDDEFVVKHWGLNAVEWEVLDSAPRPVRLWLKGGVIYSYLGLPVGEKAGVLVGEIHASGSGKMALWTSTCLRPPGNKEGAFSHSIRKDAGPFELTRDPAVFRFKIDLAPYEQGYIYINVAGEAVISHVSAVFVEIQENRK